jgi:hypothetical protein
LLLLFLVSVVSSKPLKLRLGTFDIKRLGYILYRTKENDRKKHSDMFAKVQNCKSAKMIYSNVHLDFCILHFGFLSFFCYLKYTTPNVHLL